MGWGYWMSMVVGDWWCRRWCSYRREQLCDVSEDVDVDMYCPLPRSISPFVSSLSIAPPVLSLFLITVIWKSTIALPLRAFFDFGARWPYSTHIYLYIPRRIFGEEVYSVFCQFVHSGRCPGMEAAVGCMQGTLNRSVLFSHICVPSTRNYRAQRSSDFFWELTSLPEFH